MNKVKIALVALILPFLANCLAMGMENKQLMLQEPKNTPSLIKAIVYFNPTKPAFYATNDQLAHLNKKGINTPILPIIREVAEVKVFESNGSITNWLEQPTMYIKNYEKKQLKGQTLSFGQNLQKHLILQNKVFPKFLPVELSLNCSNFSKLSLTIDQFPVQVTFASNADFATEQNNCMVDFYKYTTSGLSTTEIDQLVSEGRVNATVINTRPAITLSGELVLVSTKKTSHKEECYTSEQGCYQKIIHNKIKPHSTTLQFLRNREVGIHAQRRLNPEQDLDAILSNCLKDIEFNTAKTTNI